MAVRLTRATMALLVTVIVPATALGAEPATAPAAAAKSGAFTNHEYLAQKVELNRRTLAGAYKQVGNKHGLWDDDALKFLDRMAVYFAVAEMSWHYRLGQPIPSRDELIAAGKDLVESGCDDPLVVYCYAAVLHDAKRRGEALFHLRIALKGLQQRGYPSARIAPAAERLRRLDASRDNVQAMRRISHTHRQLACKAPLDDVGRRQALENAWNVIDLVSTDSKLKFLEELRAVEGVDPWVLGVLEGRVRIKQAWDKRGSGFADTVTDEGWGGFHKHLAEARESLVAAYKLAPHLPEPSIEMITVAMGAGSTLNESEKKWFNRALAAQIDHAEAYSNMRYACEPRWGGSYADMFDVGLRGLATNRFDTAAPWQYVLALRAIARDEGGWPAVLERPDVYEGASEVIDKYAEQFAKSEEPTQLYVTWRAALAWRANRYDDARKALDRAGDGVLPAVFRENFDSVNPPAAIGFVYAMTGPHRAAAEQAEAALNAKRNDDAVKQFRAIAEAPDAHPRVKRYAEARARLADIRARFERGEWVEVQPDADLAGWQVDRGVWKLNQKDPRWVVIEAGSFNGIATKSLIFSEPLGTRVELAGDMYAEPRVDGSYGKTASVGVCLARGADAKVYAGVAKGSVRVFDRTIHLVEDPNLPDASRTAKFVMRYDDGRLSLAVKGKQVLKDLEVRTEFGDDLRFGVYCNSYAPGQFAELKVRRIPDDEPQPAAE